MDPDTTVPRIEVAIADDHTLFRDGVREILSTDPGLLVVGDAEHGQAAIAMCVDKRPAVLLLDVHMPGPGASAVIRQVHRLCPQTQVIVLTMYDDAALVRELLGCGAAAYLVKTVTRDQLTAIVKSVARRPAMVQVSVSRQTIVWLDTQRSAPHGPLTDRESQVLGLAAEALSNAQIASRLLITEATVKRHMTNIYAKLGAVSRVDAIRKAHAARLISGGQPRPAA